MSEESLCPPPLFANTQCTAVILPPPNLSLNSSVRVALTSVLFSAVSPHIVGLPQTSVELENCVNQAGEVENPPSPLKGKRNQFNLSGGWRI